MRREPLVWTPNDDLRWKRKPGTTAELTAGRQIPKLQAPPKAERLVALIHQLGDENPLKRRKAAQKLGQMGESATSAIPALMATLKTETDKAVIGVAAFALSQMGNAAQPALKELLFVPHLRTKVAQMLRKITTPEAINALESHPSDDETVSVKSSLPPSAPMRASGSEETPLQPTQQALVQKQPETQPLVFHENVATPQQPTLKQQTATPHKIPPPNAETQETKEGPASGAEDRDEGTPLSPQPPLHPHLAPLTAQFAPLTGRAKWKAIQNERNRIAPHPLTPAEEYLLKQKRHKTPLVFMGSDHLIKGHLTKVGKYDFGLLVDGTFQTVQKLDLVCYYQQTEAEAIQTQIRRNEKIAQRKLAPRLQKEERFQLDDSLLVQCVEKNQLILLTLRTGHVIKGKVNWFTPYEIQLVLWKWVKVTVFRHAIIHVKTIPPKTPAQKDHLLNLNTATLSELMALGDIGAAVAGRILASRPFARVEELLTIKGFGEKKMAKLAAKVRTT